MAPVPSAVDSAAVGDTVAALPSASPPPIDPAWLSVLLLLGAAVSWYIAAHAAAAALPNRASALVFAGGLPALAGVLWFTVTGRTEAALALALGAAVAAATLVMGLVASADPIEGRRLLEDPGRRLKATLLPVAITLLVAGFAGALSPLHALLLLVEGALIAWLGLAGARTVPVASLAADAGAVEPDAEPGPAAWWERPIQVILAAALAIAGAGLAAASATAASQRQGVEIDATFATLLIAAILALPLIGIGTGFAASGHGLIAQRGLTLVAVFMICLAVPAVVLIDVGRDVVEARQAGTPWQALLLAPPTVPMPMRLWRTDAVVLCLAGLLLLPPAAGRFRLGKIEGLGLIGLFVVYLVVTLGIGRR